jgi:YbgC/YbaW family acyl-CoA thioester hydrolase
MVAEGRFEHDLTVRFHEVDRAGIVFFGRIFEYCHVGFEEVLSAMEMTSVFQEENWGMPLVHAEADFKRPMRMGDKITVSLAVEKVGKGSVTFGFEVLGAEDRTVRAVAQQVHAFVALDTMRPASFPDSLRTGLRDLGLIT